ncbi:helix-turn-helix domain-containing protein [Microbacterium sp. NPDC090225]|uniref:helix-turn-helix domain-containing protein n=1 Tax=Microbacterium sp. NPDC090225 TaxID=3364207 RepID=UPI003807C707
MARTSIRQIIRSGALTEHRLRSGSSIVLLVLADHANVDNEAWPSQETLAREAGMSEPGVRKAIRPLIEKGLVEILDAGGPRRSARYRLTIQPYLRATG